MQVDRTFVEVVQVVVLVIVVVIVVVDFIKVKVEKCILLTLTRNLSCSFFRARDDDVPLADTTTSTNRQTIKRMFAW